MAGTATDASAGTVRQVRVQFASPVSVKEYTPYNSQLSPWTSPTERSPTYHLVASPTSGNTPLHLAPMPEGGSAPPQVLQLAGGQLAPAFHTLPAAHVLPAPQQQTVVLVQGHARPSAPMSLQVRAQAAPMPLQAGTGTVPKATCTFAPPPRPQPMAYLTPAAFGVAPRPALAAAMPAEQPPGGANSGTTAWGS